MLFARVFIDCYATQKPHQFYGSWQVIHRLLRLVKELRGIKRYHISREDDNTLYICEKDKSSDGTTSLRTIAVLYSRVPL